MHSFRIYISFDSIGVFTSLSAEIRRRLESNISAPPCGALVLLALCYMFAIFARGLIFLGPTYKLEKAVFKLGHV